MSLLSANDSLLVTVLLVLFWIVAVTLIVSQNRDPAITMGWILIFLLLPYVSLAIYFFAGRDWKRIHARQRWVRDFGTIQKPFMESIYSRYRGYSDSISAKYDGTPIERLECAISRERGNRPLPANEIAICPDGAEYFPLLIEDISRAQHSIHMQYYIWERDELSAKVCRALTERLNAGVEVRILNDFLGSLRYRKDELRALAAAGARVGSDVRQIGKLNYRDHRKIVVIDGVIGHTGGMNIGQEYIDGGDRYPSWRDTSIRMTGPAVAELAHLFAERWYGVFRESLFDAKYFPPADILVAENPIMTHVVAQGVEEYWSSSTRAHEIAISGAEKRVLIQSPYWVPDATMLDLFLNTALSGVELKFMMTGWPDKKIAYRAAQSYWEPVIRAGGHVYLYNAGFFHAKTIAIDGMVSAVGTMNLDIRSLRLNHELMVWLYDEGLARQQEEIFAADLAHCTEVTLDDIAAWSRLKRFGDSSARLASNLL
ncbi:MAG: cardiolipin synthase [Coriobacteriia bacterium]|nr:cardiolipin synthase [Coriobacteriia bacterium]